MSPYNVFLIGFACGVIFQVVVNTVIYQRHIRRIRREAMQWRDHTDNFGSGEQQPKNSAKGGDASPKTVQPLNTGPLPNFRCTHQKQQKEIE